MGTQLAVIADLEKVLSDRHIISKFNGNRFDKEMRWSAEKTYALQLFKANEQLRKCDPETVRSAMLEVAWSGMSLAPSMAHAYLIPYSDREQGIVECTFKPGYRGLAYMAQKGGAVTGINANRVLEMDRFRVYNANNRRVIEHEENWQVTNRGKLIAVYAVGHLASGEQAIDISSADIILAAEKAASIRNPKGGMVWRGPFRDQMELKVPIRRMLKLVPNDPGGWLQRGLETVDKHDAIDFGKRDAEDPGEPSEVCMSEQQVTTLHAVLTDRGLSAERASKWLTNLADFYGVRAMEMVPASKFEDAKQRLIERFNKLPAGK